MEKIPHREEFENLLAKQEKEKEELKGAAEEEAHKDEEKIAGLSKEIKEITGAKEKLETGVSIETAKEIMGEKEVMGVEEAEKAFGVKVEKIPAIPFSKEDIEIAKELGQFLSLRADKDREGDPLTMKGLRDMLKDEFEKEGKGKITYSESYDKVFFEDDPIELSWALTSKEIIPNSTDKNYLQQTELLADYVKNKVFKGKELPKEYQEAIEEFEKEKSAIEKLMDSDWEKAAEALVNLKLNQLTRQTPAEALYDTLIYFQNNNERLLEDKYTWTKRRDSVGGLVDVGCADSGGAFVDRYEPGLSCGPLGVFFSRKR